MSHALRYGLTFVVLIAGTAAAFYFRDSVYLAKESKSDAPTALADAETSDIASGKHAAHDAPKMIAESASSPSGSRPGDLSPRRSAVADSPALKPTVVPVAGSLEQDSLEQEWAPVQPKHKPPRAEYASRERTTNKPHSPTPTVDSRRPANQTREYIVQPGDSLVEIAQCQLGNPGRYREIFDLNRDRLASPNDLYSGMVLRLPVIENVNHPQTSDAPEFDLEFAPIESDDGYTIVPTRNSQASADNYQEPQRDFIPARKSPYLPRAFRRTVK